MGVRVVFPDMGKDPSVQLIEKTITENGTYDALTDGANGYSKVNVNVEGGGGSSDFSTAKATVNNQAFAFYMPVVDTNTISVVKPASGTFDVPLYKGRLDIFLDRSVTASIESGNATLEGNYLVITGDCTITIS